MQLMKRRSPFDIICFFSLSMLLRAATVALAQESYAEDFEKVELGEMPEALFVIDGEFEVVEKDGGRCARLAPIPLQESGFLFGPSSKGAVIAEAKVFASKRGRRSFPRFALGLHGISGYRLRVVPATNVVELVKDEEVVQSAPFEWTSDRWCHLKLRVAEKPDGAFALSGWVWMAGTEAPEKPLFEQPLEGSPGQGKASVWGTPYSGKEMFFDELKAELGEGE